MRPSKQDVLIAGVGDQVFPGVVAFERGFDEDESRRKRLKSMPRSTVSSWPSTSTFRKWIGRSAACSSQIEVNVRAFTVRLCTSRPRSLRSFSNHRVSGGQAGAGNAVKGDFAGRIAGDALQGGVARPLLDQGVVEILHRLDVDAVPAAIIESLRHRIMDGIVGADVEEKPFSKNLSARHRRMSSKFCAYEMNVTVAPCQCFFLIDCCAACMV